MNGFSLAAEWMQILTSNQESMTYEPYLSVQLYKRGYYLFDDGDGDWSGYDYLPAQAEWPVRHLYIFQGRLK